MHGVQHVSHVLGFTPLPAGFKFTRDLLAVSPQLTPAGLSFVDSRTSAHGDKRENKSTLRLAEVEFQKVEEITGAAAQNLEALSQQTSNIICARSAYEQFREIVPTKVRTMQRKEHGISWAFLPRAACMVEINHTLSRACRRLGAPTRSCSVWVYQPISWPCLGAQ